MSRVARPVVRSFKARFATEAATWVRRGGHAVFWESEHRARVVFPVPDKQNPHDLGLWTVLDLGKQRWRVESKGAFRGLATTLVPRDALFVVKRRAERDSVWPGPLRTVDFDCLACGACCKDNVVVLQRVDVERFRRAGKGHFAKAPYAKRKDGKWVLTLLDNAACRHLGRDNKCAIYDVRPDACSEFPVGSECCLFSREDGLEIYDGLAPEN
jgi:Fe-S-cluster containining protein